MSRNSSLVSGENAHGKHTVRSGEVAGCRPLEGLEVRRGFQDP